MISVCIPVYNVDVRPLVEALHKQLWENAEIILIDDASENSFRELNSQLSSEQVKYIQLDENIGRARIRNRFLEHTENEYLLFLDCDSEVIRDNFLQVYKSELEHQPKVICGGRVYPEECSSDQQVLRWKYGHQRESKGVEERRRSPNASFMTNNFLVKKEVLERIPFDERITQYGHEDTLFGIELERENVVIEHIDNPILNGDVESNDVFLEKSEKALLSLHQIVEFYPDVQALQDRISILVVAGKLKRYKIAFLVHGVYALTKTSLARHLKQSKNPVIGVFNFYKLGFYLSLKGE